MNFADFDITICFTYGHSFFWTVGIFENERNFREKGCRLEKTKKDKRKGSFKEIKNLSILKTKEKNERIKIFKTMFFYWTKEFSKKIKKKRSFSVSAVRMFSSIYLFIICICRHISKSYGRHAGHGEVQSRHIHREYRRTTRYWRISRYLNIENIERPPDIEGYLGI